jgi:four helix bundle protein
MEKPYRLEERTEIFAKDILKFCKTIPSGIENNEIKSQLVRSAGSIGANYIEANEALGKKDFSFRIKICRKEAKETGYWLRLLLTINPLQEYKINELLQESRELMSIFGAVLKKIET